MSQRWIRGSKGNRIKALFYNTVSPLVASLVGYYSPQQTRPLSTALSFSRLPCHCLHKMKSSFPTVKVSIQQPCFLFRRDWQLSLSAFLILPCCYFISCLVHWINRSTFDNGGMTPGRHNFMFLQTSDFQIKIENNFNSTIITYK